MDEDRKHDPDDKEKYRKFHAKAVPAENSL